ncbi:MAG: efflux RND transporter permease subunit, partial [Steroidobacteraceae bacterium]
MVNFFIDRPIFAWVIAIVIMLGGGLAVATLPVAQYPSIAPPAISIAVTYPGASAETVQNAVTQVIEQQMNGLDHLLYFTSESDADGSMTITLYFEQGTNPDISQVQVQNKLQLAIPLLPTEVQLQGLRVAKATRNFLVIVGFVSTDGSMSGADIGDYVASHVQDPISRTRGVGDYQLFGSQYAMRIWLDPAKLTDFGLTPDDVSAALLAQNVQVASGALGGLPAVKGQRLNVTIIGPQWLQSADQFGRILLKVNTNGSRVLLHDVARVELGAENYSVSTKYNGLPASGLAIKLAPGANALDTQKAINATLERLEPFFPQGLKAVYPFDTTPFVRISIEEVLKTLFEAIVLVFIVMYVFLQNFRATLIPTIAVPVVLLGTFGILSIAGFSINTLTMFGMVLAIGLLVDDAIVVVENVERVMQEERLSARDAARKSMSQITGALVGIALVLSAVFLPMAFFTGSTGVIYRQFSITIVAAMALSVMVALVLTPALCATLLTPPEEGELKHHGGVLGWFNRNFERMNHGYTQTVGHVTRRTGRYLLVYLAIAILMGLLFVMIPKSFLPDEDQGVLFSQVVTPPGTAVEVTETILDQLRDHFLKESAVRSVFTVSGFSFGSKGQSSGLAFVSLKPWGAERGKGDNSANAIVARANRYFATIRGAQVAAFAPPAVSELGNATGFDFELIDRANVGHQGLMQARGKLLDAASKNPAIGSLRPNGLDDEPQYQLDIDWERASALG